MLFFSQNMIIEILLTARSILIAGSKIDNTLIINVDKESRRPSSRKRQSIKVGTLIFTLVKVEDI